MAGLVATFAHLAETRGGVTYFPPATAIALIEVARQHGMAVFGVEGFRLGPVSTTPSLQHILDCTSAPAGADSHALAIAFIKQQHEPDFWYEVVLDED